MTLGELRWNGHFLASGEEFTSFWKNVHGLDQRKLLIVCGAGFDPRALAVVDGILDSGAHVAECRLVEFSSGSGLVAEEDLTAG